MTNNWIFNASPLILLGKSNLLKTIAPLGEQWIIPESVVKEVSQKSSVAQILDQLSEKSKVHRQKAQSINPFVANWNLGDGESEVITLATENKGYGVVIDDLQARKCSQILNIPLTGSMGLLVRAKREGLLDAVKPAFDRLIAAGLYIDPELIKKVLCSIGE
jgi:predicted nucleic acid-binding protein